jgi:hypothetical protein
MSCAGTVVATGTLKVVLLNSWDGVWASLAARCVLESCSDALKLPPHGVWYFLPIGSDSFADIPTVQAWRHDPDYRQSRRSWMLTVLCRYDGRSTLD